jgi:hypothetical protein
MGTSAPQRTVTLTKDASGAPAVDLTKVRADGYESLAKYAEKAGMALSKRDLSGIRGKVLVLLDHSLSMAGDFNSGAVQKLMERALGVSFQFDSDGSVPVIRFDDKIWPAVDVDQSNFSNVVSTQLYNRNDMGSTDLAAALRVVKAMAEDTDEPIILLVFTDGNPNDKKATTKLVCELAGYPVFIKFLALREVDYLSELDDLDDSKRLLDNVDAKPEKGSGLNLLTCSDMEFAEAVVDELDTWVAAATAAGVLKV